MSQEDPHAAAALSPEPAGAPQPLSACWSQAGVYGNGTCPELQKFVHCRNCPVYSSAAIQLLDRALPENYRHEWTQHFAQDQRLPKSGSASLILFRIQTEWLALPTHSFQEVAEKRPLHSLPNRPGGIVVGLVNVRGELVTCISLGHLLRIEGTPSLETTRLEYRRLLIVPWANGKVAFPVDEVQGPNRFQPQELKSSSSMLALASARYAQAVLSWQDRTVGLLDPNLLFGNLKGYLA